MYHDIEFYVSVLLGTIKTLASTQQSLNHVLPHFWGPHCSCPHSDSLIIAIT